MPDDTMAGEDDGRGLVLLPGFEQGGRVEKTGIALIHEGEYIFPAPGSEARISAVESPPGGAVINYYFPVEIEVIGSMSEDHMRRVADFVYRELDAAFGSQIG